MVRSRRTTKETAAAASQRLAEDKTWVLGTVLNEWDPRRVHHSGYEYVYRPYLTGTRADAPETTGPLMISLSGIPRLSRSAKRKC